MDDVFREENDPIIPENIDLVDSKRLEYTFKCISYVVRWVVSLLQVITLSYDGSISKNDLFLWYLGHNPWFWVQIWPYKSRKKYFQIPPPKIFVELNLAFELDVDETDIEEDDHD